MKFFISILLLISSSVIYAQEHIFLNDNIEQETKHLCSGHIHLQSGIMEEKADKRPYDIIRYDLYMDWTDALSKPSVTFNEGYYTGQSVVELQFLEVGNEITLDAALMEFTSVKIDGLEISEGLVVENETLSIPMMEEAEIGKVYKLELEWVRQGNRMKGFLNYDKEDGAYERIAYTMSQPYDAHYWLPCNDYPHDKMMTSIAVKMPAEFTFASNGFRDSVVSEDEVNKIEYWHCDKPMPSYLMVANASIFDFWSEKVARNEDKNDSITLEYYVWKEISHLNGDSLYGRKSFKELPNMMNTFSEKFDKYPFKKFGTVALFPFWPGGMEHQTMQSLKAGLVSPQTEAQYVIAHELGHMWLGDMVTCNSWDDIWLNEGGASWAEAVWGEAWKGQKEYDYKMLLHRQYYINAGGFHNGPIRKDLLEKFKFWGEYKTSIIYNKAAWVYHQLRVLLGDEKFFGLLNGYLNEFAYTSIYTEDMQRYFRENVGETEVEIDTFFKQWVYGGGHPMYDIFAKAEFIEEGNYNVKLRLNQIQGTMDSHTDEIAVLFETPVYFLLYNETEIDTLRFINNEVSQWFEFELDYKPDSVGIDLSKTLCEVQGSFITSVETEDVEEGISVYPNPILNNGVGEININLETVENVKVYLYNQLGIEVKMIFDVKLNSNGNQINFETKSLQSGIYYCKISLDNSNITKKIEIVK